MRKYEMTVGLEVHAELSTETKIFCSCPTDFGAPPNTQICPICMGLPGTLPVLNRRAVEFAIKAGLATNCKIAHSSGIDRKNYFYPDLPKGYQISQYARPICYDGYIEFEGESGRERVELERIHIEEDAGKLIHDREGVTLADYNRCGRPLIEIVSEPDIHSPETARAYLKKLRSLMVAAGVSNCRMNEGSMRCDVNLSIAPEGAQTLGERTEIKNLNSFAFVVKAIEYEFKRQCKMLDNGERITRQTLRYDAASGKCEVMRSKESAIDYRFFPEPDLCDVLLDESDIERIKRELPKLPDERKASYIDGLGLSEYDAELISSDIALSNFFDEAARFTEHTKILANLLLCEGLRLCGAEEFECPVPAENLAELCTLFGEGRINSSTEKKLLERMWSEPSESAADIAEREDLWQIRDEGRLLELVDMAIAENPKAVADFKGGKSFAIRSIIGRVMAKSAGRAHPEMTEKLILSQINKII
jgi:aspartyl-tRNA(Asn)/glutamyl-tRNA(Gln) amidotransferase subunit B